MRHGLLPVLLPTLLLAACPRKPAGDAAPGTPPVAREASAAARMVQLVFTGNVRGWVEPCGCTTDPLGGVDRIRGELQRMQKAGPVLYFDAGNMLFDRADIPPAAVCQEDARVKLLLDSAVASGLKATGVGAFDLSRGDALRTDVLQKRGIPALAANVPASGATRPRLLLDVEGIKVGFTGVTWPAETAVPAEDAASVAWHGLTLAHPVKSVAREVGLLRQEGAHVVVLLGNMARAPLMQLARDVTGIDLVVVGYEPGEEPAAPQELARGTWMLSAGQQGQYLGKATLHLPDAAQSCCLAFDDGGKARLLEVEQLLKRAAQMDGLAADFDARKDTRNAEARRQKAVELRAQAEALKGQGPAAAVAGNRFTFEAVPLNSGVAKEPALTTALSAYKESLGALNAACEKDVKCTPAPAGKASYVGTRACLACHEEAGAFWEKATVVDPERVKQYAGVPNHPNKEGRLGHVRAWKTLEEAKATGNRDCIACHAVGFEEPGGFCHVGDGPEWGAVGCESCHGPGSRHVESENPDDIRREVPESTCRHCHQVPHIISTESFRYTEKLRIILGPGHGEARLKALGGGK